MHQHIVSNWPHPCLRWNAAGRVGGVHYRNHSLMFCLLFISHPHKNAVTLKYNYKPIIGDKIHWTEHSPSIAGRGSCLMPLSFVTWDVMWKNPCRKPDQSTAIHPQQYSFNIPIMWPFVAPYGAAFIKIPVDASTASYILSNWTLLGLLTLNSGSRFDHYPAWDFWHSRFQWCLVNNNRRKSHMG
jgi:hypothetical protein